VDSKDGCTMGRLSTVDAPLVSEMLEAELSDCFMEGLVPYAACLLHAVKTFHETHYPVLFSGGLKARWLFHIHSLILREDPMKKRSFNIDVLDVPVKHSGDMEKRAKGFKPSSGGSGFVVVYQISLSKSFCDISDFVAYDAARVVVFAFTNKFALKGALTTGQSRARN
jgi:hypothetical protein